MEETIGLSIIRSTTGATRKRIYSRGNAAVRTITPPVNTGSITFHARMGIAILPGDAEINGVAFTTNYDGRGSDRVLFRGDL